MAQLIKDPRGETAMDRSTSKDKPMYHVGVKAVSKAETTIMQNEVAQLKERVSELEKELEDVRHSMVLD